MNTIVKDTISLTEYTYMDIFFKTYLTGFVQKHENYNFSQVKNARLLLIPKVDMAGQAFLLKVSIKYLLLSFVFQTSFVNITIVSKVAILSRFKHIRFLQANNKCYSHLCSLMYVQIILVQVR